MVAEALKDKRDLSNEHGKLMQYFSWLASLLAVVQSFVSKTKRTSHRNDNKVPTTVPEAYECKNQSLQISGKEALLNG